MIGVAVRSSDVLLELERRGVVRRLIYLREARMDRKKQVETTMVFQ
jgi:hypothetical protein